MAKAELGELREVASGLWTARRGALRVSAFRLRDETLCLYAPVAGLSAPFMESIGKLGRVSALLAPNHFHNLGLVECHEAFGGVPVHAPKGAIARLNSRTSLAIEDSAELKPSSDIELLKPAGLKAEENWLRYETHDRSGWVVCDTFAAKAQPDDTPASDPLLRGSFATMCLGKDENRRDLYRSWVRERLETDRPTVLLPCHGTMVVADDLSVRLNELLETL